MLAIWGVVTDGNETARRPRPRADRWALQQVDVSAEVPRLVAPPPDPSGEVRRWRPKLDIPDRYQVTGSDGGLSDRVKTPKDSSDLADPLKCRV